MRPEGAADDHPAVAGTVDAGPHAQMRIDEGTVAIKMADSDAGARTDQPAINDPPVIRLTGVSAPAGQVHAVEQTTEAVGCLNIDRRPRWTNWRTGYVSGRAASRISAVTGGRCFRSAPGHDSGRGGA